MKNFKEGGGASCDSDSTSNVQKNYCNTEDQGGGVIDVIQGLIWGR